MVVAFRTELLARDDKLKAEIDAVYGIDVDLAFLQEHTRNALAQLARYDARRCGVAAPAGAGGGAAGGDDDDGLGAGAAGGCRRRRRRVRASTTLTSRRGCPASTRRWTTRGHEVVCMKSAQVAWTDGVLLNYIGKRIDIDPCPMIIMFAKDQAAKEFNDEKFVPMVEATPRLADKIPITAVATRTTAGSSRASPAAS
jgi:hypothetical protein